MTTTDTTVNNLIINTMTQAQYSQITPSNNELYLVTDSTITSSEVTTALGYTPENQANKVTSLSSSSTDTQYPSAKCVYDELQTVKRNIGEIVTSTIPLTDAGLHLLDGALLQYASYKNFIDYIASIYDASANYFCSENDWQTSVTNYGVCGKFVYDSTNNTVRLPKITGFIEGASGVSSLGDLTEAGLPNITGSAWSPRLGYHDSDDASRVTGAFSTSNSNGTASTSAGSGYNGIKISFDASDSNSIYGNSTTVQPQSVKVLYYIVIANSTKTEIEVDIDEIATDLNGKADVDLTNTVPTHAFATALNSATIRTVVETYNSGASWYRVWSDGWIEQGGRGANSTITINLEVTFLKNFSNTDYTLVTGFSSASAWSSNTGNTQQNTAMQWASGTNRKSTSGFHFSRGSDSNEWYACGY